VVANIIAKIRKGRKFYIKALKKLLKLLHLLLFGTMIKTADGRRFWYCSSKLQRKSSKYDGDFFISEIVWKF
jgi:hypothetical protein